MAVLDWVCGDSLGLEFPAHSGSLQQGGTAFLTRAFRAVGALEEDNSVTAITEFEETLGGSTGRKLLLTVDYEKPAPGLHRHLFVKFSRDFDSAHRDAAKIQMELEILFGLLSRSPDFPITVPTCYFADYHRETGTGILVTQRIPFGRDGIEPLYPKCLDYRMPDPLGHYRAIIRSLGRLAGTHRAGRLPEGVEQQFPFDPTKLAVSARAPYTPEQIRERVARYAEFARKHPGLLPENIRSDAFLERLAQQGPRFQAMEAVPRAILQSKPELVAFCHWNAHVDNAWFWRNGQGEVECGLMDWGNVCQMNMAMPLWGCLSGAELDIWNQHLDDLLALFVAEYERSGGPALDLGELKLHLTLYVAMMGLAWMLDAPELIYRHVPDLADVESRYDERIAGSERARSQLLIMSAFLNLWEKTDMDAVLDYMATFSAAAETV